MCLGNISRDFSAYNMKKKQASPSQKKQKQQQQTNKKNKKQTNKKTTTNKQTKKKDTGLNEWVYRFSVDCRAFDAGNIIDIYKNFNERTSYKIMFKIIKKFLLDY